jgi:polygalacturonase
MAVWAMALAGTASAQNNAAATAAPTITAAPATTEAALSTAAATPWTMPVVTGATTTDKDESKLKHYVITDYGAVADGTTLNTAAIQKAIDAAAAAGGGILEIPKGTFLSGSIFLKQDVDMYLDDGAVLLGSTNIEDFPKQMTRIEGHFEPWRLALVNVWNMKHVRIGGTGQLNGNGAPFWADFYARRSANPATTNLDVERARLMFVDHCEDVRIENISFQNSQFWNLHLFHSHDVLVSGLHINAASALTGGRSPSTDGIDVDSCQNITIQTCQISNNDDDIAIKGSKGPHADLLTDNPPDENILIQSCTIGDGNGLLTCGSEATIIRNVLVRNCVIYGGAKMLTLKLRPDTPQQYSNITMDGITLNGTGSMINVAPWTQFFDLQGQPGPARSIDHVVVKNITGNFGSFGSIRGNVANPQRGTLGDTINDFTIENINVNLRNGGFSRGEVNNFVFNNVVVNGQPVEAPLATAGGGNGRRGGAGAAAGTATTPATPTAGAVPSVTTAPPTTP